MSRGSLVLALVALAPMHARAQEVAQPTEAALPQPALAQRYDLERRRAHFDLPGRLEEISGLAFGPSGTLYGHNDERGVIYSIDPVTGDVGKGFNLGPTRLRDDFEGLAVAGERFFLIASGGHLYEFREAPQGGSSPVRITDTGLGATCEVEGLAYLAETESLLVACKTVSDRADVVRLQRLPLDPEAGVPPPLDIPLSALEPVGLAGGFHPSGVDVDPATGHLVLVAAREEALLEIAPDGTVIGGYHFSGRRHPQPEGIAFGPDGLLYVADEANHGDARLTVYGPLRNGEGS